MKRYYWKLINFFIWIRFLVIHLYIRYIYPYCTLVQLSEAINLDNLIYDETFEEEIDSEWTILEHTHNGSCTRNTLDVVRSSMVYQDEIGVHLRTQRIQKPDKGFYYDGRESEPRYFLGSEIQSKRYFNPRNRTGALVDIKHCLGPWYFLSLKEYNSDLPGERYRKINIFERFSSNRRRLMTLNVTVFYGINTDKKQFGFTLWLPWFFQPDFFKEDMFFIECQEMEGMIRVYLNGTLCFRYDTQCDWMPMILSAGSHISDYHGKLNPDHITENGKMTLKRIWERK